MHDGFSHPKLLHPSPSSVVWHEMATQKSVVGKEGFAFNLGSKTLMLSNPTRAYPPRPAFEVAGSLLAGRRSTQGNPSRRHAVQRAGRALAWLPKTLCMLLPYVSMSYAAVAWYPARAPLMTRWAAEVGPTNAWTEYPRPQLVRPDWLNLNGLWDYAISPISAVAMPEASGQILVPFPIESALSGVMKRFDEKSTLWYSRMFTVPESWRGRRVRLHFGAADWRSHVWVNGHDIGEHCGGYDGFTFDITSALKWAGREKILVAVTDPTEGDQPRGKQSRKPEGVFYTSTSGIWQTVWLEPVPEVCIDGLKLTPDLAAGGVRIRAAVASFCDQLSLEATASIHGTNVSRISGSPNSTFLLPVPGPHLWSPADPFLYDLRLTLKRGNRVVDEVTSYFGLRQIGLKKDDEGRTRITLNGQYIFGIGTLDQGFWPDGIYTAPTDEALRFDLEFLKRAGFNLVRKHVKVEPQRWYYWCDKLGLLVWQDMPSGNNGTPEARQDFETELHWIIDSLYNHPAVVQWVLFNEGWGQYDTERLVGIVKHLDPTRLVDEASGWTDMRAGDITDVHSYPEPVGLHSDVQRATVVGEFGGIGLGIKGHSWASKTWGYQTVEDSGQLEIWYVHLLQEIWNLHKNIGLSAAVYTQLTDIESECNGLMTYDRAVMKLDPAVIQAANRGWFTNFPATLSERPESPGRRRGLGHSIVTDATDGAPTWRFTLSRPAPRWSHADFDDSGWGQAQAGFGTPGTPGAIVRTIWDSSDIWLRRTVLLRPEDLSHAQIEIHHDEDVEVYINGVLAFKQSGFLTNYADLDLTPLGRRALNQGINTIAVHCHQTSGGQYIDVGLVEAPGEQAEAP